MATPTTVKDFLFQLWSNRFTKKLRVNASASLDRINNHVVVRRFADTRDRNADTVAKELQYKGAFIANSRQLGSTMTDDEIWNFALNSTIFQFIQRANQLVGAAQSQAQRDLRQEAASSIIALYAGMQLDAARNTTLYFTHPAFGQSSEPYERVEENLWINEFNNGNLVEMSEVLKYMREFRDALESNT